MVWITPRYIWHPCQIPRTCEWYFCWNKVFADKIQDLKMKKSSSITRWVQIQWPESLWDTEMIWQTERKVARLRWRQTLEWQDQKTKEDNTKRQQKQEGALKKSPLDLSERTDPCLHLDFRCLTSQTRRINLSQFVATIAAAAWHYYSLLTTSISYSLNCYSHPLLILFRDCLPFHTEVQELHIS